jgi:siroheme synthase-like protein
MPLFPAFLDLTDRAALVVGQGAEADRKAEKMAPFCRTVLRCPYPPVWEERPALVILAEKDHPDNERWAAHFRSLHIPVNVSDRPELCDFSFPSLIVRGDVSVGIATGGCAPALAALLRERLEDALPDDLEPIIDTAALLTAQLRKTIPDPKNRSRILREELQKLL